MAQSGRNTIVHVSDDDSTYLRVGNISQAGENIPSSTEDRNVIGVQFQSRTPTMLDRTMSLSGFYDPANAAQILMRDAVLEKTKLYTKYYPLGSDGRKQLMVVDSLSIGVSTAGLTTVSFEFSGAGALSNLAGAAPSLAATETQPYSGRSALIKASGTGVSMTDEAMTDLGAHTAYQITDAAKRIISPYASVVVEVDTVAAAASSYTINRLTGTITFLSALAGTETVTITSTYLPLSTIADAKSWDLSVSNNSEDASVLGDTWTKREPTLGDVSGSFARFHVDDAFITKVIAQELLLFEFYVQSSSTPEARAWGYLNSAGIDPQATSLIEESLDWSGSIDTEGRSIAFLT